MKYQALYDAAKEAFTVVRVKDNTIPLVGYAIGSVVTRMNNDDTAYGETFDVSIARVVAHMRGRYVGVEIDDKSTYFYDMEVFADKIYAAGYAHGKGTNRLYDLSTGEWIHRKVSS